MNRSKEEDILRLLESVEKEDAREEERHINPGAVRRNLFVDEPVPEPIDELASDDDQEDELEVQEDVSGSEESAEEEEEDINGPQYIGKDKSTTWNIHCPQKNRQTRIPARNIVRHLPGVRPQIKPNSPMEAWLLLITDDILDDIVKFTNQRIEKVRPGILRESDARDTSRSEMGSFIGLLFMAGVLRASHLNLEDLWATDGTGVDYFRSNMNMKRFKFLIRNIRFDDSTTRRDRKLYDKLAPIRDVFDRVVEKFKTSFSVSEYLTVDEMLEAFRGRCPFRQYIRNKPAKYGIKVYSLACAKTFYTLNMEVYAGKQPEGPYKVENSGLEVVQRMVEPVRGTGRSITTDNWFTSIPLAETLLANHNLTLVGTIKKNKREIPPVLVAKGPPVNSSVFAFRKNLTLVAYTPKKNKVVTLISTMHDTDEIDPESGTAAKPYIMTFYNSTKCGVDVVDQYKERYSVSRTSNRWPLTLFFTILNISGLNSFIIYKHAKGEFNLQRRAYLKELSRALCLPHLQERSIIRTLPTGLKRNIRQMLGLPEDDLAQPQHHNETPGRCAYCDWRKNRKSKTTCSSCKKYICKEHSVVSCVQCASTSAQDSSDE